MINHNKFVGFLYYFYIFVILKNTCNSLILNNNNIASSLIKNPSCNLSNKLSIKNINNSNTFNKTNKLCTITNKLNRGRFSMAQSPAPKQQGLDSGSVYFSNLLKSKLKNQGWDNLNYPQLCEKVKGQIADNYSLSLMDYASNKLTNISQLYDAGHDLDNTNKTKKDDNVTEPEPSSTTTEQNNETEKPKVFETKDEKTDTNKNVKTDFISDAKILGSLYESSILGSLAVYLEMTNKEEKLPLVSGLTLDEKRARLTKLLELLSSLQNSVFTSFKFNSNKLKLVYITQFFNRIKSLNDNKKGGLNNNDLVSLDENDVIKLYKDNLNYLAPSLFKTSSFSSMFKNTINDNIKALCIVLVRENLMDKDEWLLLEQMLEEKQYLEGVNWNMDFELEELKLVLINVKGMVNSLKVGNFHYEQTNQNLLETIASQQHKIKQYNKLLNDPKLEQPKNLSYGITYRIPNTNLTLSSLYHEGVNNIELSCIPDHSAGLLGHNGFVKSLPFGSLGINLNMTF